MESDEHTRSADCQVVVGPDETAAARLAWPDRPIVTLVDASEPDQAVYARAAGADVVLPTTDLAMGWRDDTPGLAVAVSTATSLAERRMGLRQSSRSAAHDLGQALSAINLATELAIGDEAKNDRLLRQIQELAKDAGAHAWQAGRGGRSSGLALRPVDLSALLHRIATAEPDVVVYDASRSAWVLGDIARIEQLLEELIQHGRHWATRQRIDVKVGAEGTVDITIWRTGNRPIPVPERDVEFGLVAVGEIVNDLGGKLHIGPIDQHATTDPRRSSHPVVRLSLPLLPHKGRHAGSVEVPLDRMAIQTNILEGVLRHAPLAESLEAIVTAIEQQLPGSKCSVLLLEDGQTLHHGAGASLPEAYRQEIDGVAIGYGQGSCGTAAYLSRPVIARDVETNQHWIKFKDLALAHGLRSCWSTPIHAADGGDVLGTFAVYQSEVWEPDDPATRLVSRFTYLAAVAIGHHRLFNAVAESESRFRSAFEGATAGMALVATDGSFLKVNPALCTMLESTAADLCQTNVLDLLEPVHRSEISSSWIDVLTPGRPPREPIELPIAGSSGDPLWVSISTSLVCAENDDQQYLYVEIRDVSARRRHAAEQRAREAAEAASQAKTDFLALVSHELRTPLNAILGFAQLMKLVDLDAPQQAHGVDNILKAGQHLLDLINELLDLSLIEARQVNIAIEHIDASNAVDEALEILGPLADTRTITLRRDLSTGLENTAGLGQIIDLTDKHPGQSPARLVLSADRQCLRQVLINLIGNALKFTPSGGEVAVLVSQVARHTVRIRVLDSGPGIPADQIGALFQPFHRLTSDTDAETEGTGLGLSVAARLAAEMRGSVGVESEVGVGSCFWIDLPIGTAPSDSAVPHAATSEPSMATKLRPTDSSGVVLYVEDDPASVQVLGSALALRPGITLVTATNAADAVAATREHRFDAILLDIGLPDGSGWDLLAQLRHESDTATVPVIVLTAGSAVVPPDSPAPDLVMAKPLDIAVCLESIDTLLNHEVLTHEVLNHERLDREGLAPAR